MVFGQRGATGGDWMPVVGEPDRVSVGREWTRSRWHIGCGRAVRRPPRWGW